VYDALNMMDWFLIDNVAFSVFGYPLSYIELFGTLFGLISVFLASRNHIWTWPTGIVNEFFFFVMFFQVQLYSDMFLQVYFFVVTLYGWYFWKRKSEPGQVSVLGTKSRVCCFAVLVVGTLILGFIMSDIHLLLPEIFKEPASFPYPDAFTTTASILATVLLARRRIETWIFWIAVDVVCVVIYLFKGIAFVAVEYGIFLVICLFGLANWRKMR